MFGFANIEPIQTTFIQIDIDIRTQIDFIAFIEFFGFDAATAAVTVCYSLFIHNDSIDGIISYTQIIRTTSFSCCCFAVVNTYLDELNNVNIWFSSQILLFLSCFLVCCVRKLCYRSTIGAIYLFSHERNNELISLK